MSFLKLRGGYLLINPAQIASVEKLVGALGTSITVTMANHASYNLADEDAETVLRATAPTAGTAPVGTNIEAGLPAGEYLQQNAGKVRGKTAR